MSTYFSFQPQHQSRKKSPAQKETIKISIQCFLLLLRFGTSSRSSLHFYCNTLFNSTLNVILNVKINLNPLLNCSIQFTPFQGFLNSFFSFLNLQTNWSEKNCWKKRIRNFPPWMFELSRVYILFCKRLLDFKICLMNKRVQS